MKQRFRFEKLGVWQDARALNRVISRLARKLPQDENYIGEAELDPVLERASVLAGRIVALNRSLVVTHTKTPFDLRHAS
jgi:hypothetical protein